MLKTTPAVFAVEHSYHIMVQVSKPALFWVTVGESEYYDESNGIMCSLSELHRVIVPMEELDKAGKYTVHVRPLIERKPYFTETEEPVAYTFVFNPVPKGTVRAYHISDAHNLVEEPVAAAKAFGRIDLLILNGDVIDHSGNPSKFDNVYKICDALTGGSIPVVFSRGNHDMRGNYAEKFAAYTPNANGNTYYTFRLGGLWGILLDCGEDKPDGNAEYGYTICCNAFRRRQTEFLKKIIANKEQEYQAPGVTKRLVISHMPFTTVDQPPFDIEQELYAQWVQLLHHLQPDVMICGHTHTQEILPVGGPRDAHGQPCPVVLGAAIQKRESNYYRGCGYTFTPDSIEITFTDSDGKIVEKHTLK